MSHVARRALSCQKRKGRKAALDIYGKRQRQDTAVTGDGRQPDNICTKRESFNIPKPADWDDDTIYDGLDIDKLVAQSQNKVDPAVNSKRHSAVFAGDNGSKKTDNCHSGEKVNAILTGSPELFEMDCSGISSQVTHNYDNDEMWQSQSGKNAPKHSVFVPVATSTQYDQPTSHDSVHKKGSNQQANHCHITQASDSENWFHDIGVTTKHSVPSSENAKSSTDGENPKSSRSASDFITSKSSASGTNKKQVQTSMLVTSNDLNLSLGSRLKEKLRKNAKESTPVAQHSCRATRRNRVNDALKEVVQIQTAQEADKDIGPFYGLPSKVRELLTLHRGISKLYDWQHMCLTLPSVKSGKNLIYSLPTSGGKTLVAEILIFQQLLCHKKDAILILPYVSIVQEKVSSLSVLALELGFLVEEYAGTKGAIPPRKRRKKNTLFICTIEKAHSLVNSLITEKRIDSIGLVVVDELHMLGDGSRRGASLESTLSKLKYLELSQVIGMSATLSNVQDLCQYLNAEIYTSQFRPVELTEYIKIGDGLYQVNTNALCPDDRFSHSRNVTFPYTSTMKKNDPDHLLGLALEVIPYNSCLIFCATKKNCQSVAQLICKYMPRNVSKTILAHKRQEKEELLHSLRRECDDHLCSTLKKTVPFGVAYHHSGLTMDERKLIEESYNDGTLCLLACTSTLAAGVNLPAKRVILRSPYVAKDLLTLSRYKQMVGRAGRAGFDSSGESILIVQERDRRQVAEMFNSPLEGCHSSLLHDEGKGLRSLILSVVALQMTVSKEEVQKFMDNTLLGAQSSTLQIDVPLLTREALQQLIGQKLIKEKFCEKTNEFGLQVTSLGKAAFKGAIDIDQCSQLYQDLEEVCAQGMVLANTLHLLFLVTPYELTQSIAPDWLIFDRQFSTLGDAELKVAELIGITEHFIKTKITGSSSKMFTDHSEQQAKRFYLALMLWNILNRKSIWQVAERFEVSRGFVQSLFTSAASFASSIQRFCEDLPQFWAIHQLLSKVTYDLSYCATADLIPLLEVSGVKQGRARQLVNAGYKTLRHLAFADVDTLVRDVEHLPKKVAREIISAAKLELAERAEALKEEAEEMMMDLSPSRS